jgi:hypothetical protein
VGKQWNIAAKVKIDGRNFGSKFEAAIYQMLKLREKAGEIRDIETQVSVRLTKAPLHYIADFKFFDLVLNEPVWAEAKGFETPVWRIKLCLWKHGYGPGRLEIYRGTHQRIIGPDVVHSTPPSKQNLFKKCPT